MKEKRTINVAAKITESTFKAIQKEAEKDDRTVSYIINKALEEYAKEKK